MLINVYLISHCKYFRFAVGYYCFWQMQYCIVFLVLLAKNLTNLSRRFTEYVAPLPQQSECGNVKHRQFAL
jgi:hypothetical protein